MGVLITALYAVALLPLVFLGERLYFYFKDRIAEHRWKTQMQQEEDHYLDCLGTLQRRNET